MCTKVLAILALATIANCNDVIVGLKTDGRKFFDENRQANPALWRQMDNVTIKAPENEIIRRVVITDLRPDKDGDVKIVEGGEGQKNVTIELKSPTVLRGYEFHIEVYSTPEENVPFTNDQRSTAETVRDGSTTISSTNPTTNLDTASKFPDLSTDKIVPAILTNDEVRDSERQGRNVKNEQSTSDDTTELTTTTLNSEVSSTATTHTESVTENRNEKSDDTLNKSQQDFISSIPLNKGFNTNPVIPAISGKDITNETRHVRDIDIEKPGKPSETKLDINPTTKPSTENEEEATTTEIDAIPVEEKSDDKGKEDHVTAPISHAFDNRKYTSIISSKVEHPDSPVVVKDAGKLRNSRGANEEQNIDESVSTTTPSGSTTTDMNEASTLSTEDCVTTEAVNVQNPTNIGKDDNEIKPNQIPIYLNNRQWNQRFNNPTFQAGDSQSSPDLKINPAVSANDHSTIAPDTEDAERIGNDYKPSPDHMESRNPKMSAAASHRYRNIVTPVLSTQ